MNNEVNKKSEVISDCLTGAPRGGASLAGPRPPSPKDMAARATKLRDLKDRSMVLFLLDTGLREDEIALLDMDAIEFSACERPDGNIETVGRGTVPIPKSDEHQEFFLSVRTVEALNLYWASRRHECAEQVVLTTRVGGRRLLKLISMMIREWCYRFIFERLRVDKFRHSLVHHLFGGGCSPSTLGRPPGSPKSSGASEVIPLPDINFT